MRQGDKGCKVEKSDLDNAQADGNVACARALNGAVKVEACKVGVEVGTSLLKKELERGFTVRPMSFKISGVGLGFFRECATNKPGDTKGERCPSGFESLVVKRDKDGIPQICVCRLGPKHRKKFRGQVKSEADRKPFGSEKKPKHLRRCVELYTEGWRKGQCKRKGPPGVTPRPI
jgi:hypothetical protein